jgi:hypothetical protein
MSVENCIRSIERGYLHLNRVDSYKDFPDADQHDSEQLSADRHANAAVMFAKAPDFSFADYCDQSRSRTYAFCASLENSDYIWTYSSNTPRGNVGVVFDFDKLRASVNRTLQSGGAVLQRSVLLLVSIEEVTYAEAARILDIPIGTVMSRLARARERLLKLLEEQRKPASDRPHLRRVQ